MEPPSWAVPLLVIWLDLPILRRLTDLRLDSSSSFLFAEGGSVLFEEEPSSYGEESSVNESMLILLFCMLNL